MFKVKSLSLESESISIMSITKAWFVFVINYSRIIQRIIFITIDYNSQLFLDDSKMKNFTSCFKEKKFLQFFFKNLKLNNSDRYTSEFPYMSLCGRERNFVRCDDYPIVYTNIIKKTDENKEKYSLSYGHAGDLLMTEFIPNKLIMIPDTGRVYHPASEKVGSIGLVRSKLAIELSKHFVFENGENLPPTHLNWDHQLITIDQEWYKIILKT